MLSVVAAVQKRHADDQARIALSRQLAATSATELSINPRVALLLAASAYRIDANPQTFAALMQADTANPQLVRYFDAGGAVTRLGASGDGKRWWQASPTVMCFGGRSSDPEPATVIKLSSAITSIAVSTDATAIAAADNHTAALWRSGHDVVSLPVPDGRSANAVAVSPSGKTAVVNGCFARPPVCEDASDVIFDVATASQRAVRGSSDMVASYLVASSDDDLLLFSGSNWQRRRIADWALTESSSLTFGAHQVNSEPSADGEFIAATNGATTIGVWRMRGTQPINTSNADLTAHGAITSGGDALTLSPQGTALAIADAGSIYVAPVASANAVTPVAGITDPEPASGVPARAPTVQLPARASSSPSIC